MIRLLPFSCPVRAGCRRSFTTLSDPEFKTITSTVNEQTNRITSLWGMRNIKINPSQYFKDDLILKLACKHLGQTHVDSLLSLSPENKSGKLPNAMSSTKIIYEDSVNTDIKFTDNDIWLGYTKYISFLNLSLQYRTKNFKNFIKDLKWDKNSSNFSETPGDSHSLHIPGLDPDDCARVLEESEDFDNFTIFVFPYLRRTSKAIVDTLSANRNLFSDSDFRSLVYASGSTGSSRLLSLLGTMMNENFSEPFVGAPIYKVESHAWPWMANERDPTASLNFNLPLMLDALSACSIIRYSIENESRVYDSIIKNLKDLDAKIQELTQGTEGDPANSQELEKIVQYDELVLEKVLSLLVIRRNLDQLSNDQIRAFSDFVCDRLHRIKPKLLANLSFSLGHSKNLDEFWMFMISKQIQTIINSHLESQDSTTSSARESDSSSESSPETSPENSTGSAERDQRDYFDMDDVTAILDAYSTAGLEDYNFYSTICAGIKNDFPNYTLHHKSVVIRSLAKVRHRDPDLLEQFMDSLKKYINELNESLPKDQFLEDREHPLAHERRRRRVAANGTNGLDNLRGYLIKPIDSYIVASAIVSACDLDFRAEEIDALWRVLTLKVKDSSFDICAISWLPIATITFPSLVSLTEFLPVWLRQVNHTIHKLRSKTFMMTIQRRQLLIRHAFNLGILPRSLLTQKCSRILDEICDKNYITCKEDYIPESSTFHLEVCACLRALGVTHQREINVVPFVMDIVISPDKVVDIKSSFTSEAERATDLARCGNVVAEGDLEEFPLKYNRNSPNHRKHKEEIYTFVPTS